MCLRHAHAHARNLCFMASPAASRVCVKQEFECALEHAENLDLDEGSTLLLSGLEAQARTGDCNSRRPSVMFGKSSKAKYDAHMDNYGVTKSEVKEA